MRILQLDFENFGSYQKGSIDLRHIHSATVSGKNGSGKSTAFIDGPLWCLFGKCRTDSDSMMKHDQERMSVSMEFELDGQVYRVVRTRSKATKAGKTDLTFMVESGEGWLAVGGHKLMETQAAIIAILNADYDLCVTTNFLVQGKADKFSTATASERKTILSQVLRLDEYATLKFHANQLLRECEGNTRHIEANLAPLAEKIKSIPGLRVVITEGEACLHSNNEALLVSTGQINEHHKVRGETQTRLTQLEADELTLTSKRGQLEQLKKDIETIQNRLVSLDEIVGRREKIEKACIEYDRIRSDVMTKRELEQSHRQKAVLISNELRKATDRQATERETLERVKGELKSIIAKSELIMSQYHIEVRDLQEELIRDRGQGELLTQVPCWKELQEKCQFTIEAVAKTEGLPNKTTRLQELHSRNFVDEQYPNFQADCDTRHKQIEALSNTGIALEIQKLDRMKLEQEGFANQLEKDRAILTTQQAAWSIDFELRTKLETALVDLKHTEKEQAQTQKALDDLGLEVHTQSEQLKELPSMKLWMFNAPGVLSALERQQNTINGEIETVLKTLTLARAKLAEAGSADDQAKALEQDRAAEIHIQQAAQQLHKYYADIPVMIMEQAVPNLEATTNQILEKISPSGMRVRLETQKALKSSDKIAETLDILVRDVHGEKPYENYSGGEKFRLDLAIRFGLSQLLMHRAGSKMETLIIDEGLGSLDHDGLALLRECLGQLETNFGLIIVISHVDEIVGTFETQIMCEKTTGGSTIQVIT